MDVLPRRIASWNPRTQTTDDFFKSPNSKEGHFAYNIALVYRYTQKWWDMPRDVYKKTIQRGFLKVLKNQTWGIRHTPYFYK